MVEAAPILRLPLTRQGGGTVESVKWDGAMSDGPALTAGTVQEVAAPPVVATVEPNQSATVLPIFGGGNRRELL